MTGSFMAGRRQRRTVALLDGVGTRRRFVSMKYRVTLVESDEGWAVWCDALPGCCSQGATRNEALANIRDAIAEYLAAKTEEINADAGVRTVQHEEVTV
jgi:predicted RNase H-like HicB family nuclease